MSIKTTISKDGKVRTIYDDMNPRLHQTEYRCTKCHEWINSDDPDLFWIDPKTGEETDGEGNAYCGDCVPPERKTGGTNQFGGDTGIDADFDLDIYSNKDINES